MSHCDTLSKTLLACALAVSSLTDVGAQVNPGETREFLQGIREDNVRAAEEAAEATSGGSVDAGNDTQAPEGGRPAAAGDTGADAGDSKATSGDADSFKRAFGGLGDLFNGTATQEIGSEEGVDDENDHKVTSLRRDAITNYEKGRYHESIRYLNDLISLRPYDPDYHFAQALCYRKLAQYSEALKKYQDTLDLGGARALISLLKAEVAAAEGKRDSAIDNLREAAVGGRNIIQDVQSIDVLTSFQIDTDFIQLALQLERIEIQPNHHDPFTNPFPRVEDEFGEGEGSQASNEDIGPAAPAEQAEIVQSARQIFEQIQIFIKLQDEDKAMEAYMELQELMGQRQRLSIPKYLKDFDALSEQLGGVEVEIAGIRLRYYYNQAKEKLAVMEDSFEESEFNRVRVLDGEIQQLAEEMVKTNEKFGPVADQIREISSRWVYRADVRLDFESRKPSIQGIVVSEGRNLAILDDRIVKQGDSLVDFRVVKVESNRVTFRYKGEEIPLVFKRY